MKTKRLLMMIALTAGMIGARAYAQNLFVSDYWADSIYYFTPTGVRNTCALPEAAASARSRGAGPSTTRRP